MPGYIMDLRKLVGHRTLMQCAASIIIVNEKNQILLGKRTDNHKWGYAGGSIELDEKVEDVYKRQILANQKKITVNNYILDENIYIGKTALKIILSNLISNAVKYTDVNGVINIGIVNDWLYIENTYGNNKISNMDKIFDVKFDLNKENSNGLGLYIVSNILNNYNMEYKALQNEEFFIFKIKIFS